MNSNNNSFGTNSASTDDFLLLATLQDYLTSSYDLGNQNNLSQTSSLGSFLTDTQELSIVSSSTSASEGKRRKQFTNEPDLGNYCRPTPGVKIADAKKTNWMIELGYAFRDGNYIYCNVDLEKDNSKASHLRTAAYFTPDSSTGNMKRDMMKVHDLNEAEAKQIWEQNGRRISTKAYFADTRLLEMMLEKL
ncbi:hypothetical protein BD560DRAFT_439872 [Blakeslea trispora]|nr:hypothetical protein BD560DRAFT_439872 [Blakeslea trispora]